MDVGYMRRLAEYHAWANGRVFEHASTVPADDYTAERAGLSFGSLHGTLVHLLSADDIWLARWREALPPQLFTDVPVPSARPSTDVQHDYAAVARLATEVAAALNGFVEALTDPDLHIEVEYRGPDGVDYRDPLSLQLAHVLNHGTQFRTEAAVRLTELGRSPGNLDLTVLLRRPR